VIYFIERKSEIMIRGTKALVMAVIFIFIAIAQILDRSFLAIFPFFCGIYFFLQWFKGRE
jgi:hypothetical protein